MTRPRPLIELRIVALTFAVCAVMAAVVYAQTTDDIWRAVFDTVNNALRINQVTP